MGHRGKHGRVERKVEMGLWDIFSLKKTSISRCGQRGGEETVTTTWRWISKVGGERLERKGGDLLGTQKMYTDGYS